MKLEWIGHACFRMTSQAGTRIITDPYDSSVGIGMPELTAELITMSHEHHDHNEESMIRGTPLIVRDARTVSVGDVTTTALCSWHDDARGALRGGNIIRLFAVDGLKIVHMGDQGCMPDAQVLSAIAHADVMLLPVGGTYTVDGEGARAIVEAAMPRCVIPMHMRTRHVRYPIAAVGAFLEAMGVQEPRPCRVLELSCGHVPQGVVLMQPQADEL